MLALIATIAAVVFSGFFPEKAAVCACPLFMSSLLVLGMPHGAVDPLLLLSKKKARRWLSLESRGAAVAAYLGSALLIFAFWSVAPVFCLFGFLFLTAFHWGTSEYEIHRTGRKLWLLLGMTRGGLIVLGVLSFQREDSLSVMRLVTGLDPQLPSALILEVILGVTAMAHIFALAKMPVSHPKVRFQRGFDSLLLLILLAFTPALLGMGVYYMVFHALRYYDFFEGERKQLFQNSHLLSALGLVLVLAVSVFIYTAEVDLISSQFLPAHFMALAALTLPHAVLVTRLQFQQIQK